MFAINPMFVSDHYYNARPRYNIFEALVREEGIRHARIEAEKQRQALIEAEKQRRARAEYAAYLEHQKRARRAAAIAECKRRAEAEKYHLRQESGMEPVINNLNSFFNDFATLFNARVNTENTLKFTEDEKTYTIALKMPYEGITKKDLDIDLDGFRVTVDAKSTSEDKPTDATSTSEDEPVDEATGDEKESEEESDDFVDLAGENDEEKEMDVDGLVEDIEVEGSTEIEAKNNEIVEKKDEKVNTSVVKKSFSFKRAFTLPEDSNLDSLKVKFEDGLLTFNVEKVLEDKVESRKLMIE
jgi:HSP20 family molecular chaperone IbpA